jgi:hypothetical protein
VRFYRIAGLSVASEIDLPGLVTIDAAPQAEVTIRFGPAPETLAGVTVSGASWQIAGKLLLFRIPDIARFLLIDGGEIVVAPESEAAVADIPVFILGTVFGILLHQREQVVLHASAVEVSGQAVLFCGASGAGKSTLAAALTQRGYPLVTDDFCALTLDGAGAPLAQSDGRQLKLWGQAIDRLKLAPSRGANVRKSLEKFYVQPLAVYTAPLPVAAVYILREARPPHAAGIERPNVVDASLLLLRNAYRPALVRRMNQKARYFRAATALANLAGVFHLTRALDFDTLPQVVASLERHWMDLRLTEAAA